MANSTTKSKTITTKELGEWLATFYKFSTKEEYAYKLHAIRCIFDAENDEEFWNEACEYMKKLTCESMKNKLTKYVLFDGTSILRFKGNKAECESVNEIFYTKNGFKLEMVTEEEYNEMINTITK